MPLPAAFNLDLLALKRFLLFQYMTKFAIKIRLGAII
ncbi:MAG: hypothetical protein UZ08_BCD001002625 [Candidatus Parvibacillus calidus]|jgi:hypothetical protein|nr:MAG: hypothetical protein UZ08_BCD001002625 [Candidatus Parvibacillus calidus]